MDDFSTQTLLIWLAGLLVASGFFSIAETSMMAINRFRLRHLASQGNRGARLAIALLDRTDADARGFGPTTVPAHAIGEHQQALAPGASRLAPGVLVLAPAAPDVAQRRGDELLENVDFVHPDSCCTGTSRLVRFFARLRLAARPGSLAQA